MAGAIRSVAEAGTHFLSAFSSFPCRAGALRAVAHRQSSGAENRMGLYEFAALAASRQATVKDARRIGLMHGLLNAGAAALYGASLWQRRRGEQRVGRNLAYAGYAVSLASAYLGGHLVFNERVGVDHTAAQRFPREFTPTKA